MAWSWVSPENYSMDHRSNDLVVSAPASKAGGQIVGGRTNFILRIWNVTPQQRLYEVEKYDVGVEKVLIASVYFAIPGQC